MPGHLNKLLAKLQCDDNGSKAEQLFSKFLDPDVKVPKNKQMVTDKSKQTLSFLSTPDRPKTLQKRTLAELPADKSFYEHRPFWREWYQVKPNTRGHNLVCEESNGVMRERKSIVFQTIQDFKQGVIERMNRRFGHPVFQISDKPGNKYACIKCSVTQCEFKVLVEFDTKEDGSHKNYRIKGSILASHNIDTHANSI